MTAPAAIKATFADYKRIRSRKLGQLIFEIPLEQLHSAIATLGGEPSVEQDTWVGIARLDLSAAPEKPKKEKRRFEELPPAQQAALACQREAFQRFMYEQWNAHGIAEEAAAHAVRRQCGVESRSDLGQSEGAAEAWRRLYSEFQLWLQDATA